MEWIAAGAIYNSDEFYDAPKCYHQTRTLLDDVMQWVINIDESGLERDDFMLWLHGPASTGKTAIAKRIAEIAADKNFLIATFVSQNITSPEN